MQSDDDLPDDFLHAARALEAAYLRHDDPIAQSGFRGGAHRWREERSPILDAVDADGDILDVGCANGYLLECLVAWGTERHVRLIPHGVDIGPRLIELARQRFPQWPGHFHVANAWDWHPPRQYRYVYALYDCVPETHLRRYVEKLLCEAVAPGGRLIVGAYGSRSRNLPPLDIAGRLASFDLAVAGRAYGGDPPITAFAWVERPSAKTIAAPDGEQ